MNFLELPKVLTTKGYAIRKGTLTEEQKKTIQKELTVSPDVKGMRGPVVDQSFRIFRESPDRYYVPRQWGIKTFGTPDANLVGDGTPLPTLKFIGTPYDYQTNIINTFVDSGGNGLICVPCGKGKTFMAVAIAAKLGRRFLVVVDKEFLMNQWKGELQALLPGLRIGICQADRRQVEPETWDCTICMIQTLCKQDFPDSTFHSYGFTIFDECHHLGAQYFSKALMKIQTKWMLGLSATPQRDDGLTKVFEYYLGEPVYWEKTREPDPMVIVRQVLVKCEEPTYLHLPVNYRGEVVTARLLTQLVDCAPRTEQIARIVAELCADPRRRVLVLSERISHLNAVEALLTPKKLKMAYYIGGMKEDFREKNAAEAQVLLASYSMASEAMNIKVLNTVILASPRKKVEQSTGRILRIRPDQRLIPPLIVDIVDVHGMYRSQWKKRCVYYRKCKYTIQMDGEEVTSDDIRAPNAEGCLIADESDDDDDESHQS